MSYLNLTELNPIMATDVTGACVVGIGSKEIRKKQNKITGAKGFYAVKQTKKLFPSCQVET